MSLAILLGLDMMENLNIWNPQKHPGRWQLRQDDTFLEKALASLTSQNNAWFTRWRRQEE